MHMTWTYICILYLSAFFILGGYLYCKHNSKKIAIVRPVKRLLLSSAAAICAAATATFISGRTAALTAYGVYYIFIDIMMISLIVFVRQYTGIGSHIKTEYKLMIAGTVIDAVIMIYNIFTEKVFSISQTTDSKGFLFWEISKRSGMHLYHLIFMYISAAIAVCILTYKTISTPKLYKVKYASILFTMGITMLLHIFYLQLHTQYDYSLLGFTATSLVVPFFSLVYIPRGLSERLLFFSVANMKDGIICVDMYGNCVHYNEAAKRFCSNSDDPYAVDKQAKRWLSENFESDNLWSATRHIEGQDRYYDIEFKRFFDEQNQCIGSFFILHDKTDDYNRFAAEQYHKSHDALTGIYKKDFFYKSVEALINASPGKQFYIVSTDVKNFKMINDIFGMEAGDSLLKLIASITASIADNNGCAYGRLSGDRFAMCLPAEYFNESYILRQYSKVTSFLSSGPFKVHVHIGVYPVTDRSIPVSVMCDRANLAIMTIKDSYQNVVAYYDNSLREKVMSRQKVISQFERALKTGEFKAFVQPQVTADGHIRGGEVLVRWVRPDKTTISPGEFIATFEQTGLISRLDSYMWEIACRQLRKWHDSGMKDAYLSVNISKKDFYLIDVYAVITSLVKKYKIPPHTLHLEITETAVMNDPHSQIPLIERLRSSGFMVEIDDFGSGYSSLNTLKDITADVLKLDMGFLTDTEHTDRSKNIMESIIELAKKLDMEIITEGVEYIEQVEFLSALGCDMYQGYFFAKPMPIADFEKNFLYSTVEMPVRENIA